MKIIFKKLKLIKLIPPPPPSKHFNISNKSPQKNVKK